MCINSLLHYPSVRSDWLAITTQYIGGGLTYNADQLHWSDSNVKLLREELGWDYAGRQSGSVLAVKAYNLLYASGPHFPPTDGFYLPDIPNQNHLIQPSMAPEAQGFNQPSSIQAVEHLPFSSPMDKSSYHPTYST